MLESLKKNNSEISDVLISGEGNKSECRNRLVKESGGDVLVFLDDDVELRYNTIRELLLPFNMYDNVGVVGGVNVAFQNIGNSERLASILYSLPITMFKSSSRYVPKGDIRETNESEIISCVMAVKREAFFKAGGYPEDIIPCEENVLVNNIQKLGYKIIYNPFAVVYHRRAKLYLEYAKTLFEYGKGRGIMVRKGSGSPKMFYKPNLNTIRLLIGLIIHYVSYICGLICGLVRGR